jgi:hypothetical protein
MHLHDSIKPGMKVELVDSRGMSFTMIGALSSRRGIVHTSTFCGSNNAHTFLHFIKGLRAKCQGPTLVVMDNLCVHKAKIVRVEFDENFQQVFLPPQSCNLNPIKKVWNLVKRQWRAQAHLVQADSMRDRNEAANNRLQGIVDGLDAEKMKKVAKSNIENMARSLRGHLI